MPEDRIYEDCYGLQTCDAHSSTGEIKFNNRSASVASLKRGSDSAGHFSADWKTKLSCRSSSAGLSPLQVPRKAKNLEFPMQKNFERRVCLSQEAKKEFIW